MARRSYRELSATATAWVGKLQRWTVTLPHAEYTTTYGNPTFKVHGKSFLVLDRYHDTDCLWLRVAPSRRTTLLTQPGWFASPYDPNSLALCVALESIDGRQIRSLIRASYAVAAAPLTRKKKP